MVAGTGAALKPIIKEGTQQVLEEWVQPLARQIFGNNQISKGAADVLNKTSRIDIDTFSKGIEFDAGLREPLERTYNLAGEGDVRGYELLTMAGDRFKEENLTAKAFARAEKNYAKSMQSLQDAADPTVTGAKGRAAKNQAQTGLEGKSDHTAGTLYDRKGLMITNRHHGIGLDDANPVPTWHSSWDEVTPGNPKSPIIQARESVGIKSGNNEENLLDVLDSITQPSRTARIAGITEQTKGILDSKTIDDSLGMTGYQPRTLDTKTGKGNEALEAAGLETQHFEQLRQQDPTLTVERYMAENKSPITGSKYAQGSFPNIRVFEPGSQHFGPNKAKPLEVIEIKTAADHKNRFNLIFDALDRHNIDTKAARQNFKLKELEIDKTLDVYGGDHPIIHKLINTLKKKPGTALNEIETLGQEGVRNLSLEDAIKLDIRSIQEMETVAANVLQFRYAKVEELFKRLQTKNPEYPKVPFDKLPAELKQKFFKQNINTIAVMGNLEKAIPIEKALAKPKNWNNHIADTFGWRPQSIFATVEEIEAVAKELAEKVPTTAPGVE